MRTTTGRACFVAVAAACLVLGAPASAIVFNLPGYSQTIVANIPGTASNHFGGVVQGLDNNLYLVGGFRADAFRVTPAGVVTALTLGATDDLLGAGIVGTTLYVGQANGRIDTFDISLPSPTATFLATLSGSFDGNANADFAVASAGFGSFGGQLISCDGGVYAVNPTTGAKTDILVTGSGNHHSSLDFGPNGTLYVAEYENARVITVSPTGATSVFATLPGAEPDGLAVHPGTGDLYVADSNGDQIIRITPGGVVSTFATDVALDGGYYPSGIAFSRDGSTLYYLTNVGGFALAAITGFGPAAPGESIPALGLVGLLVLATLIAAAGVVAVRRLVL